MLRLTADLPTVSGHWTDTQMLAVRADALNDVSTSAQAVEMLRAGLAGPPDGVTSLARATLVSVLFAGLLRGEVPPTHQASVVAEIRAYRADWNIRLRAPVLVHLLAAQVGYLDGRWPVAIARSVAATRLLPPGQRGEAFALTSLACSAAGDAAGAAWYLDAVERDDPGTALAGPARARLAAAYAYLRTAEAAEAG